MRLFWQNATTRDTGRLARFCALGRQVMETVLETPIVRMISAQLDLVPTRYCPIINEPPHSGERRAFRRRLVDIATMLVGQAQVFAEQSGVATHSAAWVAWMQSKGIDPAARILDHFFTLLDTPRVPPRPRRKPDAGGATNGTTGKASNGGTNGDEAHDATDGADSSAASAGPSHDPVSAANAADHSGGGNADGSKAPGTNSTGRWAPTPPIDAYTRLPAFIGRPPSGRRGKRGRRGPGQTAAQRDRARWSREPRPFDPARDEMRVLHGLTRQMISIFLVRSLDDEERAALRLPSELMQMAREFASLRRQARDADLRALDRELDTPPIGALEYEPREAEARRVVTREATARAPEPPPDPPPD